MAIRVITVEENNILKSVSESLQAMGGPAQSIITTLETAQTSGQGLPSESIAQVLDLATQLRSLLSSVQGQINELVR